MPNHHRPHKRKLKPGASFLEDEPIAFNGKKRHGRGVFRKQTNDHRVDAYGRRQRVISKMGYGKVEYGGDQHGTKRQEVEVSETETPQEARR